MKKNDFIKIKNEFKKLYDLIEQKRGYNEQIERNKRKHEDISNKLNNSKLKVLEMSKEGLCIDLKDLNIIINNLNIEDKMKKEIIKSIDLSGKLQFNSNNFGKDVILKNTNEGVLILENNKIDTDEQGVKAKINFIVN